MSDDMNRNRRDLLLKGTAAVSGLVIASTANVSAQTPGQVSADGTSKQPTVSNTPNDTSKADIVSTSKIELLEAAKKADNFGRTPEEEKIWQEIRARINGDMPLTNKDGSLGKNFLRIEKGFAFLPEPEDTDFRALHIEPLLDQAADLLERSIRDRTEWDDKAVKNLNLTLELHEYDDLDAIHKDEEKSGYYEVPFKQSAAELNAERLTSSLSKWSHDFMLSTINAYFSPDEINHQYNWARRQAWLTGLVAYLFETPNFKEYVQFKWDGVPDTVSHHAIFAAEGMSLHNLRTQLRALTVQMEVFDNNMLISDQRVPGFDARTAWERADVEFKKRRTAVARRYQDLKARAATEPDGILNYDKRMTTLQQRFQQDFRGALARMKAIQPGLDGVYGYTKLLPKDETSTHYVDDCVLWVRDAISWLIRFSRAEQNYVLPISIRNLGNDAWKAGLTNGVWEFDVTEGTFPDERHVRLRGISATVDEDDGDSLWQVGVLAPRQGTFHHLSNRIVTVDQSDVPICRMARVTKRGNLQDLDVVGVSALHNASPIGRWRVSVNPESAEGTERKKLRDIQLNLHLAVRSPRVAVQKFIISSK